MEAQRTALWWVGGSLALMAIFIVALGREELAADGQPLFDQTIEVHASRRVEQSFLATQPGLHRVDLALARRGRAGTSQVVFRLRSGEGTGPDLVTATIDASRLEDVTTMLRRPYTYSSFAFPAILDSAGKRFHLLVEASEATAGGLILIRYQTGDPYPAGAAYIDGTDLEGDLAFKVYYDRGPLGNLDLLLSRLIESKPFPWNAKAFYIVLLLIHSMAFVRFLQVAYRNFSL